MKFVSFFVLFLTALAGLAQNKNIQQADYDRNLMPLSFYGGGQGRALDNFDRPELGSKIYFNHIATESLAHPTAITLTNEDDHRLQKFQITTLNVDQSSNRHMVLLAPGQEMTLTLGDRSDLSAIQVLGLSSFNAVLETADQYVIAEVQELVYELPEDLVVEDAHEPNVKPADTKSYIWTCTGNWSLISSGYSAAGAGDVFYDDFFGWYNVYWRSNTPIGNWYTMGVDGSGNPCTATWTPAGDGCPFFATDCLGNAYYIVGAIPVY